MEATRRQPRDSSRRGQERGSIVVRFARAWRVLDPDQRLAASAAFALFATMLLPWYTKTDTVVIKGVLHNSQTSFTAFGAFSFVEAAVLLVSAGVLGMLFARAERRAFHLPGGDGVVVMLAGAWAALLIFYRLFDKPTLHGTQTISATEGVTWGIFIALLAALALAYAGWRIRAAGRPEPPLRFDNAASEPSAARSSSRSRARDDEATSAVGADVAPARERFPPAPAGAQAGAPRRAAGGRGRPILTREDAAQLSFDDPHADERDQEPGPEADR